jgi:hypothetical protein
MTPLREQRPDRLSPADRALLELLANRQRSYAEIGTLLMVDEREVRIRAHTAADRLVGGGSEMLAADDRGQIVELVLGMIGGPELERTTAMIAGSRMARQWRRRLELELSTLLDPEREESAEQRAPAEIENERLQEELAAAREESRQLRDELAGLRGELARVRGERRRLHARRQRRGEQRRRVGSYLYIAGAVLAVALGVVLVVVGA